MTKDQEIQLLRAALRLIRMTSNDDIALGIVETAFQELGIK